MKKIILGFTFLIFIMSTTKAQDTKYLSMSPNLMIKDMKISQEFYVNTLGFEILDQVPKDEAPVWMMLGHGEITFMLQSTESITDEIPSLKKKDTGGTLLFYVTITEITSYFEVVSKQAKVIKPLHKTFYGATEFTIEDPDGYLITFAEFPQ